MSSFWGGGDIWRRTVSSDIILVTLPWFKITYSFSNSPGVASVGCRQFMSVRLPEENLVLARIRCVAFWIVSLEQEHWSVGDKLKRFKYALKFPCPVRNWNYRFFGTVMNLTSFEIECLQRTSRMALSVSEMASFVAGIGIARSNL
ncbi:hypothetical protein TNCV_5127631 [Trichonephila clavipes]|nr:hypothetical protein TNCV_5127631 [Trichonephila clavipes]